MENKELRERMLSGKMYNDLSVELVQRREQAVFLTKDYILPNTDIISSIICILRVNNGARKPSDAPVHSFYWSIG